MDRFVEWNAMQVRRPNPLKEEEMFGPEPIFENSGFYLNIMTSIFWDFEKEIWYDPSAKQEVMTKLWLNDGEFLYD